MATFNVRFLGCKVSHLDAQDVRERLLADGHEERDGATPTSRSSTRAASRTRRVSKSRQAAARAARTHRRVYVTGCAANLAATRSPGCPGTSSSFARRSEETPAVVAGDVGAIGCVQADARLERVRAFVKIQDGCSFSCNFCVIPLVRGGTRSRSADAVLARDPPPRRAGHKEVVLTGINLGCFRDRAAGYDLPRLVRQAGRRPGSRACASPRSRSTTSRTSWSPRCARRRRSRATCTCRCSPATTACCARWAAATPSRRTCAGSSRSATSTSPAT